MESTNTQPKSNAKIARRKTWFWIGGVGAVLAVALIAYGLQQNAANNTPPIAPPSGISVQSATSGGGASAPVSGASFNDAAKTWSDIEAARGELDSAIQANSPEKIHDHADKIRDLVRSLPNQSAALPPDKRQALETEVKHAEETAKMLRDTAASSDTAMLHEHHQTMQSALDAIRGLYPAQALRHERHGEHAAMSGRESAHDAMPDNGMAGMSKLGGAMPDGMGDDSMPGGGGKMSDRGMDSGRMDGMMDKMMSGMGKNDKQAMQAMMPQMKAMMSEMKPADRKEMMEEMMAMPPAQRAKAMQQKMKAGPGMGMGGGMSGATGKKAPDKSAPPKSGSGGMSGGGMGDGHM